MSTSLGQVSHPKEVVDHKQKGGVGISRELGRVKSCLSSHVRRNT